MSILKGILKPSRIISYYDHYLLTLLSKRTNWILSLAIDFRLDSYVRAHLTPQSVQSKKVRPILDYILRPRFAKERLTVYVGIQLPDSALLNAILGLGANPNQKYQGISIWALFWCFRADHFQAETPGGHIH